ncbi:hypothetical protein BDM02DRAFT_3117088, partial [Thelephora ganbajun]
MIEVITPLAAKYSLGINPFPVSVTEKVEAPWNVHHLSLDILPTVDISVPEPLRMIPIQLVCAATD